MSWLRNSQLRSSISTKRWSYSPPKDCDPVACTESFKKHWQQASEIIERTQPPRGYPVHDDVLAVVNHVEQMVKLLVVEIAQKDTSLAPCLEHLLSETILHRLFEWSQFTGRYRDMVKLEQMKLYELLVSQPGQVLLVHEPVLRPLLRLLVSCSDEVLSAEIEKRLVILLNQLCVSIVENVKFLDLFFTEASPDSKPSFLLFSLLIQFVHRSGAIGQQARDALLHLISLSSQNEALGAYIADHSNVCPVLATGLSGLYSVLPRKFEVECEDWHRLTTDDVNQLPDLILFINSLEFCNAVIKIAHKSVKDQLLEFIYQGFLLPVMGTALLQESMSPHWGSVPRAGLDTLQMCTEEELVAATAYYELFLRYATSTGLLPTLTKFIMMDCYDGRRILTTLIARISSKSRLSVVTLALLETLVSLDSEDVMVELIFKYLTPCTHVMLSQRARLRDSHAFSPSAQRFLNLTPNICQLATPTDSSVQSPIGNKVYGLRPEESLYGNYHAYLCDARSRIHACVRACRDWRYPYDGENPPASEDDVTTSLGGESSGYESFVTKGSPNGCVDASEGHGEGSSHTMNGISEHNVDKPGTNEGEKIERRSRDGEALMRRLSGQDRTLRPSCGETVGGSPDIGPFLDTILNLVEKMPSLSLHVNLRLTGLISRLAVYPHPLLTSFLLNHSLVFQPSIRSLFQTLRSLKQNLDKALNRTPGVEDLIAHARQFLLQREERLASMRKAAVEGPTQKKNQDPFSRGDSKRSSFSSKLQSVFRMALPSSDQLLENEAPGSGYRYVRGRSGSGRDSEAWDRVLSAVLLDEWLKELAAIAQEQALYAITVDCGTD